MVPRKYWVCGVNIRTKIKVINVFWAEQLTVAHLTLQDRKFYESFPSKQTAKHKHNLKLGYNFRNFVLNFFNLVNYRNVSQFCSKTLIKCYLWLFYEAWADWLAAWRWDVHLKLTVPQLVNKFSHFMEPGASSQQLTHCPYPEPDQSRPCPPSNISKINFNIIFYLSLGLKVVSFSQISLPKPSMPLYSAPFVLRAPPISFFLIWSP